MQEAHSHRPALISMLGSQHLHPDLAVKKPGLRGSQPVTHDRVGSPDSQSSSAYCPVSHPVQEDNADCLMGTFKESGVSEKRRQGCP